MSSLEMEQNLLTLYFSENRELLNTMETSLLILENNKADDESINSVFRAVHTIKGNSGMFGFDNIVSFTHVLENLLDQLRNGIIDIDNNMISLFLKSHDFIQLLMDYNEGDEDETAALSLKEQGGQILSDLVKYTPVVLNEKSEIIDEDNDPFQLDEKDLRMKDELLVDNKFWHISIRLNPEVFQMGLDPYSFISFLSEKGEIVHMKTIFDDLPFGEYMDPELCYLGFEIDFKSEINKNEILDIFDFLIEDSKIVIIPPRSSIYEYINLIKSFPETPIKIGEMLIEIGSLSQKELDKALNLQESSTELEEGKAKLVGEILVEEKMIPKKLLDAAVDKQEIIKKNDNSSKSLIKVDSEKLDSLINLIGELVITGANVKQISMSEEKNGLIKSVVDMTKLIDEIRDSTMGIRMVQIGETFSRFQRMVRDLSKEQNKKIKLLITGGDTELDKTLIDKISDPLVHLIRNSVDHGIGTPEIRKEHGKKEEGTITLAASHETGSIVIEVSDDGNGLGRERIYNKCVEKGILQSDQKISDYDLFQNIFNPGFSTATEVTNISGRGVGMDVVKRNIESLRGNISLESKDGEGTKIQIVLPLTLAIIDGFMVSVGENYFVIPLDMVTECTEVSKSDITQNESGNYINLRGDVLPFMKMREFIKEEGDYPDNPRVIVIEYARKKAGLVVDDLIGEFQTVIKPMGKIFNKLKWISGSTILGTGEIAYILDIPNLLKNVKLP